MSPEDSIPLKKGRSTTFLGQNVTKFYRLENTHTWTLTAQLGPLAGNLDGRLLSLQVILAWLSVFVPTTDVQYPELPRNEK